MPLLPLDRRRFLQAQVFYITDASVFIITRDILAPSSSCLYHLARALVAASSSISSTTTSTTTLTRKPLAGGGRRPHRTLLPLMY